MSFALAHYQHSVFNVRDHHAAAYLKSVSLC